MEGAGQELSTSEAVQALERFVVENDDLFELEERIGRFNVFDVLRVVRTEIRHSNFLAWLLDPSESHGQGQLFLRAVLMDMLRQAPSAWRPMSPVDLDGVELGSVEVRREWRHIDLLIIADDPKVVIAIENKIHSGEHSNQLARYEGVVGAEFPEHTPMYVFLTREGDEPSEAAWVSYDYGRIHETMDRVLRRQGDSIGDEIKIFLRQYLTMIRSRLMDDERIDELCDRVYRNHRQALDLIFERKGDPRRRIVQAFFDQSSQTPGWHCHNTGYGVHFVPQGWLDILPPIARGGKLGDRAWLRGVLWVSPTEVTTYVEVTPCSDESLRAKLVDAIKERGKEHGLALNRGRVGSEWTAVARHRVVRVKDQADLVDSDEVLERVGEAVEHWRAKAPKITAFLRTVFEHEGARDGAG